MHIILKLGKNVTKIDKAKGKTKFHVYEFSRISQSQSLHKNVSFEVTNSQTLRSLLDKVSNIRNRILTNLKPELVTRNFQWNCMMYDLLVYTMHLLCKSMDWFLYDSDLRIR